MDQAVQEYIDAIAPEFRPLFDRLHGLALRARPEAEVLLSYGMPCYRVGRRRLFLGVWQHGVSLYGWSRSGDAGFTDRHPGLTSGRGTIRLRPEDAAEIPDQDLLTLLQAVFDFDG